MKRFSVILMTILLAFVLGSHVGVSAQQRPPMPPNGSIKGELPPQSPKKDKPKKEKKKKVKKEHGPEMSKVYMFGFSASFTDSVAFVTDVMEVDSVYLRSKYILVDRPLYSIQLEDYVTNVCHVQNSTNTVFFSKKKKNIDKKYGKVNKLYKDANHLALVTLKQSDFRFKPEEYIESSVVEQEDGMPQTESR